MMKLIEKRPFLVVRAAGSGIEGSGDLLALRGDICFPIEVNPQRTRNYICRGELLNSIIHWFMRNRSCLMPLYAYRLKGIRGDSWRIFRVETETLHGQLRKLESSIPSLPLTRNGKPYLNWEAGLPLNEFIALVCSQAGQSETGMRNIQVRSNTLSGYIVSETVDRNLEIMPKPKRNILAELKEENYDF